MFVHPITFFGVKLISGFFLSNISKVIINFSIFPNSFSIISFFSLLNTFFSLISIHKGIKE